MVGYNDLQSVLSLNESVGNVKSVGRCDLFAHLCTDEVDFRGLAHTTEIEKIT